MTLLNNMPVGRKLFIAFAAVLLTIAAMGGAMVAADRSLDITAQVIQRLTATPGR